MSSSELSSKFEAERQRLRKVIHDSNNDAATVTAEYQSAIAQNHAAFSDTSRKYSRWVERQARKLNARLDKKRKQMERNKKVMGLRRDELRAETEQLHAKIAQIETARMSKITEATKELEQIERRVRTTDLETANRLTRSRAPSPDPFLSICTSVNWGRGWPIPSIDEAKYQYSCVGEACPRARQACHNVRPTSVSSAHKVLVHKAPYRKIIWKVIYKKPTSDQSFSVLPSSFLSSSISDDAKNITVQKTKDQEKNQRGKIHNFSSRYIWEEYDHSEVFEEPDDPDDEDYEPEIED